MALALVCLSLTPALAAPCDMGNKDRCNNASFEKGGFGGQNDWMLLVDDATRENFDNMTLAQIRKMNMGMMGPEMMIDSPMGMMQQAPMGPEMGNDMAERGHAAGGRP